MKNPATNQRPENHRSQHAGWLRAAVLGANDGIISTASLIVGVASAGATHQSVLLTGTAGLVAGAMSMASGEFVSVSSQADSEKADLMKEQAELEENIDGERAELADIYVGRGLTPRLAGAVAEQLMEHDALASHARDELGITDLTAARSLQAAVASAICFSAGAALPLLVTALVPVADTSIAVFAAALVFLILMGMVAASVGGSSIWKGALRVGFWGALAMAVTAGAGVLFGAA